MSHSTFSVHPDNPCCFLLQGRPLKLLTSAEHYGAVLNGDFDYDTYLETLKKTRQNATRVFTFYRETAESILGPGAMNTLAPRPEASILPWARSSGGAAASDGLARFGLDAWNPVYFRRFQDFVQKCGQAGVVVEATLFCNPYDQNKYDLFPCSSSSNVNGVGGDLVDPRDFMTLRAPGIVAFQERFVRKLVTELNPFDNLYYEICNEPNLPGAEQEVTAWHDYLTGVIRDTEEALPKRHLIAANAHMQVPVSSDAGDRTVRHEDRHYFEHSEIDLVNYHYLSEKAVVEELDFVRRDRSEAAPGLIRSFLQAREAFEKPIVFDETFSGIVRGTPERYAVNRAEAWEMMLSGGAGYSNLDWTFTVGGETGSGTVPIGDGRTLNGEPLREWIGVLHEMLGGFDLSAMRPAGVVLELARGYGWAASTDGSGRYLLYIADDQIYRLEACVPRELSISLKLPEGS